MDKVEFGIRKHELYGIWTWTKNKTNVCERWRIGYLDKHPFLCFLEDMGDRPQVGYKLQSIDGTYSKEKCFWRPNTKEYLSIVKFLSRKYNGAKGRCQKVLNDSYEKYNKKGIKFCWDNLYEFIQDCTPLYQSALVEYPGENLQIDRINNSGNYEKGNVRFVPARINNANKDNNVFYGEDKIYIPDIVKKTGVGYHKVQYRLLNNKDIYDEGRKDNHLLEYNGKKQPISVRAKELGLGWSTVYNRIIKGRPIEEVLSKQKIGGSRKMKIYQKV